tara:strand:- start:6064 stop:7341 length:1278 start_codon:yes stop_codon:yes gene_type:complete
VTLIKLKEISTKIGSGATPKGGKEAYKSKGISLIRSMNVYDSQFKEKDLAFIDDSQAKKLSNVVVEPLDILLNITGASVARCCLVPEKILPARVNQHVAIIRIDKNVADPRFIYMCMISPKYKSKLLSLAQGGATREALTKITIEEFELELPQIITQTFIADSYLGYDNLIENNNRRIAILEDMAQSLYREWFVNFRYPGHADAVDKDGNQKLIDSPLGQIPEGWNVDELKPFCSKIGSGATPRGGKGAYQKEGVPLIRSMNIYDSTLITKNLAFIDDVQAARLKNVVVEPDDVLLNITGASVARCSIVPSAFTPARVNQHVAIIRLETNQLSAEYLMYTLISANGKARLLSTAQGGATREALTKTDIEKFKIVIPPPNIIKKFNALVKNTVKQKEILFLKNENLKKQRDMLLPKLISGQIELKD